MDIRQRKHGFVTQDSLDKAKQRQSTEVTGARALMNQPTKENQQMDQTTRTQEEQNARIAKIERQKQIEQGIDPDGTYDPTDDPEAKYRGHNYDPKKTITVDEGEPMPPLKSLAEYAIIDRGMRAIGFHNPVIQEDDTGVYAWYEAIASIGNDFAHSRRLHADIEFYFKTWLEKKNIVTKDYSGVITLPLCALPHLIDRDGFEFDGRKKLSQLTVARKLGILKGVIILRDIKSGAKAVQFPPVNQRVLEFDYPYEDKVTRQR